MIAPIYKAKSRNRMSGRSFLYAQYTGCPKKKKRKPQFKFKFQIEYQAEKVLLMFV